MKVKQTEVIDDPSEYKPRLSPDQTYRYTLLRSADARSVTCQSRILMPHSVKYYNNYCSTISSPTEIHITQLMARNQRNLQALFFDNTHTTYLRWEEPLRREMVKLQSQIIKHGINDDPTMCLLYGSGKLETPGISYLRSTYLHLPTYFISLFSSLCHLPSNN